MICEELSRHGDLVRDLAEISLSPENCEQWFERAVMVFVGVMLIVMVVRVSFCSYNISKWTPWFSYLFHSYISLS
jgi:hypothetical protein